VDGARIEAVGYGDERPIASNDNDEGRQQNRRIEAIEL
jgi:OOP family OmpA-OmpF porin